MLTSTSQPSHAAQCSSLINNTSTHSRQTGRTGNDSNYLSRNSFRRILSSSGCFSGAALGLPPLPPRSRVLERLHACRIGSDPIIPRSLSSSASTGGFHDYQSSSARTQEPYCNNPPNRLNQGLYQQWEGRSDIRRSDVSRSVQCRAGSGPHRRPRRQFPSTPSHSTIPNSSNPPSNPYGIQQPPSTPFSGRPESPARRHRRREQWRTRLAWWDNLFSRRPPEPPPGWPGVPDEPQGGPPGDPRRRSRRAEGEPGTRRGGSGGPGGGEPGTRRGGSGGLGGWDTGTRRGGGGGPGGGESGTRRGGSGGGEAGRTGSSNRGGFSASGGGPKIEAPGFKGSGWGGTGSGSVFGKGFGQTGPGTSGSSSGPGEPGAPLPRWQKRQIVGGPDDDIDAMLADPERFERWQTSRELRGIQLAGEDPDDRQWEDWIDDPSEYDYENGGWYEPQPDWEKGGMPREAPDIPERGMSRSFKELLLRIFKPQDEVEESLTFEERVFRYTSQTTAKFVIFLIAVPWACSWVLHDYILTPFMHHYAHTTPLVARMLDLREEQKLNMIERLKLERQRIRFEADIGKAPPLSEDGLAAYLQEEAREMREEIRHENEAAFAYIFSDTVGWLIFAFILYANPSQVGIMKLTGDRIFTNISDTGKAFVIILCSDIFLGYHSESGWETVVEMFLDHYGLVADQNSIYIFVAIVPVTIDSFFKLWVFKYLVRLSPSAAATFREMKRH